MEEVWKGLTYKNIDYSWRFEVSNTGKLRNTNTKLEYKFALSHNGYPRCNVSVLGKKITFRINRAIAETFLPNPNGLPQVNHKDGCKINNCVDNLEWCTRSDNVKHAYQIGLNIAKKGENAVNSKLTEEDVRYIRQNYNSGHKDFGCRALAKKFNIHPKGIYNIINNRMWKHIL